MTNVTEFPKSAADEALAILDEAWSYYMPAPVKADDAALKRDETAFEAYYEAA